MICTIIANGKIDDFNKIKNSVLSSDLIIAADGGCKYCLNNNITPHLLIGDFDSLSQKEIDIVAQKGTIIEKHPKKKDETDLELAINYAVRKQANEIFIYGGLGYRWDMTIANILLLANENYKNIKISLLDNNTKISVIQSETIYSIKGDPGDIISLIPLRGDTKDITTKGLEYSLNNEPLFFGATRGVSNKMTTNLATISITSGLLLCVHSFNMNKNMEV